MTDRIEIMLANQPIRGIRLAQVTSYHSDSRFSGRVSDCRDIGVWYGKRS